MSLLDNAFEDLTIINKATLPDGYGGLVTTWSDGATIKGALVLDNSTEAEIAKSMGTTSVYTLTVRKSINLDYHTVIRRESDKQIFRLTNDAQDKKTPDTATLNMRVYKAEKFALEV